METPAAYCSVAFLVLRALCRRLEVYLGSAIRTGGVGEGHHVFREEREWEIGRRPA